MQLSNDRRRTALIFGISFPTWWGTTIQGRARDQPYAGGGRSATELPPTYVSFCDPSDNKTAAKSVCDPMAPHTSYTPVSGMEYEEPVSRTYQYRKVMKPMLERKRRARINRCLDELKDLMVTALQAEGENVAKLEKADILELTVRHLHTLRAARRLTLTPENSYADRFRDGFTQCAQEVSTFLSTPVAAAVHPAAGAQLMRHLGGCLRRLETPAGGANHAAAAVAASATTKTSTQTPGSQAAAQNVPQNVYTPPQSPVSLASSSGEPSESSNAVWRPW